MVTSTDQLLVLHLCEWITFETVMNFCSIIKRKICSQYYKEPFIFNNISDVHNRVLLFSPQTNLKKYLTLMSLFGCGLFTSCDLKSSDGKTVREDREQTQKHQAACWDKTVFFWYGDRYWWLSQNLSLCRKARGSTASWNNVDRAFELNLIRS